MLKADGTGTSAAIEARELSRSFGMVRALEGLSLALDYGRVVALVGPNGAGKTTLLLILAGLLSPDRGAARVGGHDPVAAPYDVHATVGWMPDFFGVYDDLTPREYLELFGAAYRLPRAQASSRAAELLEKVNLAARANAKVHTLSRGQKQRLGFARSLIHTPRILLLDEPASGLDPRARIELRDLVRLQASEGVCVLISSHILQELEEMADEVVFMDAGRCTGSYRMSELPSSAGARRYRIRALDPATLEAAVTSVGLSFESLSGGDVVVEVADDAAAAELVARLVRDGVRLIGLAPEGAGLQGAFLSMGGVEA